MAIIRQGKVVETGTLEELRHLTRTSVNMTASQDVAALKNVAGVYDFHQKGNQAVFSADESQMNAILEEAVKLGVQKFEAVPPTLEDLFMRHYEG